jgi:hypothetical protein
MCNTVLYKLEQYSNALYKNLGVSSKFDMENLKMLGIHELCHAITLLRNDVRYSIL